MPFRILVSLHLGTRMRAARLISSLIFLSYANGEVYDGKWTAGLKEVTGTRYDANVYNGEWEEGMSEGTGTTRASALERGRALSHAGTCTSTAHCHSLRSACQTRQVRATTKRSLTETMMRLISHT